MSTITVSKSTQLPQNAGIDAYTSNKTTYQIILEKDEDGSVVVSRPDLQGVVTDGATEEDAIKNAYEAVQAMLESLNRIEEFNLIVDSKI